MGFSKIEELEHHVATLQSLVSVHHSDSATPPSRHDGHSKVPNHESRSPYAQSTCHRGTDSPAQHINSTPEAVNAYDNHCQIVGQAKLVDPKPIGNGNAGEPVPDQSSFSLSRTSVMAARTLGAVRLESAQIDSLFWMHVLGLAIHDNDAY